MSKKKVTEETRTSIDNINDTLTGFGAKVQSNLKKISIIGIIIAVIVVAIIGYIIFIKKPADQKKLDNIGQIDRTVIIDKGGNVDSVATAMYLQVADNGDNRGKLMTAIGLYNQGKYDEAIKYLKSYKLQDKIIGPASLSLLGDCYVNTDKLDDAISAYQKAIKESGNNPYYTPLFMVKIAHIYHEQKKYADEEKMYQEIVDKYPQFLNNTTFNIKKDLERAKILAGKK